MSWGPLFEKARKGKEEEKDRRGQKSLLFAYKPQGAKC